MNRLLPNNAWDFFQRFHLSWRRLRSKCIQSTNIWLYWDSTETLLRLYWSCYRSFLHSFPFHMAKVSPTKALPDTVLPPFVFGLFLFEDVQFLHEFCTSSLLGHHLVRLLASTAFALEKHGETVQVRWVRWGWSNIIRNSQISRNSIWNIWKLCSCKAVRINTNLHTFKLPPYSERK
jgi:hypothetical protein